MKKHLSITIASILAIGAPSIVNAQLSFTATVGGIPSVGGATLETFNSPSPSILTLSGFAALEQGPNTGFLDGGLYVAPAFSGATAAYFGEPMQAGTGFDASIFVAVGSGGSAKLTFSNPEKYFGLLWGTPDPGNILSFYDSANNLIGTVTGSQVSTAINGTGSALDTAYVNVTSTTPFSSVVATYPGGESFEFDDVAYAQVVPEPASILMVSIGLVGLRFGLRRKSA